MKNRRNAAHRPVRERVGGQLRARAAYGATATCSPVRMRSAFGQAAPSSNASCMHRTRGRQRHRGRVERHFHPDPRRPGRRVLCSSCHRIRRCLSFRNHRRQRAPHQRLSRSAVQSRARLSGGARRPRCGRGRSRRGRSLWLCRPLPAPAVAPSQRVPHKDGA